LNVKLVWATPNGEALIAEMARVSNPTNKHNSDTAPKLLKYLVKNQHWSPFEMVNVCVEIETTRDIARQILRHRSFSFQEFSQRYAVAPGFMTSECRLQDYANRQNSIETDNGELHQLWLDAQHDVIEAADLYYKKMLDRGVAKEVARKLLPEGLTISNMYMNGSLRSWIHYINLRCDKATQKEHRLIAEQCRDIIYTLFPSIKEVTN
jgi:thymidylate synthase (FAD)